MVDSETAAAALNDPAERERVIRQSIRRARLLQLALLAGLSVLLFLVGLYSLIRVFP